MKNINELLSSIDEIQPDKLDIDIKSIKELDKFIKTLSKDTQFRYKGIYCEFNFSYCKGLRCDPSNKKEFIEYKKLEMSKTLEKYNVRLT